MRRYGWTTGLVPVLVLGCTRPNPAFGLDEGEEGKATETAQGEGTVGNVTTSGFTTTEGADGSATQASTLGASGPDGGSITEGSGSEGGPLDTGPTCAQNFAGPYGIESDPALETALGGCPELGSLTMVGSSTNGNTQFVGEICPDCNCAGVPISLTFDVPLPPLAGCFNLVLQLVPGTCEVVAYTMVQIGGPAASVVSNVITPDFAPLAVSPVSVELDMRVALDCNEVCLPPSGLYGIFADGILIPPTGLSVPVGQYMVVNDGSGIDQDCVQIARWHATRF